MQETAVLYGTKYGSLQACKYVRVVHNESTGIESSEHRFAMFLKNHVILSHQCPIFLLLLLRTSVKEYIRISYRVSFLF